MKGGINKNKSGINKKKRSINKKKCGIRLGGKRTRGVFKNGPIKTMLVLVRGR